MAVAEIYIKGVSTRKVQDVFSEMCNAGIPAGQVSRAMRELDAELERWRNRPISEVKILQNYLAIYSLIPVCAWRWMW